MHVELSAPFTSAASSAEEENTVVLLGGWLLEYSAASRRSVVTIGCLPEDTPPAATSFVLFLASIARVIGCTVPIMGNFLYALAIPAQQEQMMSRKWLLGRIGNSRDRTIRLHEECRRYCDSFPVRSI